MPNFKLSKQYTQRRPAPCRTRTHDYDNKAGSLPRCYNPVHVLASQFAFWKISLNCLSKRKQSWLLTKRSHVQFSTNLFCVSISPKRSVWRKRALTVLLYYCENSMRTKISLIIPLCVFLESKWCHQDPTRDVIADCCDDVDCKRSRDPIRNRFICSGVWSPC